MSSVVVYPVASCSGISIRKRKNDSDSDSSGDESVKIPRGSFHFVLESESEIPSSEEETESIISLQNKSTDFAKDTSDTSSKTSCHGSDFDIEYEVVSLSETEDKAPSDSFYSGSDLEKIFQFRSKKENSKERLFGVSASDTSEGSVWADGSSAPDDPPERDLIHVRPRSCLKCKAPTWCVLYCSKCYKVRKDFFPPRPKLNKRKKSTRSLLKKKFSKEPSKVSSKDGKVESGIESSSSQEIMLTPEPNPGSSVEGLCNICFKNPKDGAFIHFKWVHIYSCYECSVKIWFSTKVCPLCNGKVNNILKVAMG